MAIVAVTAEPVRATTPPIAVRGDNFPQTWQASMRWAVRDPAQILDMLELGSQWLEPAKKAAAGFPLFAPLEFIRRMEPGNPHDPLLRQVLPLGEELISQPGFTSDPVGDLAARAAP